MEALDGTENEQWRRAMNADNNALERMKCLDVMKRPSNQKVVHSKFVLVRKRDENGNVRRRKARLVVCGNDEYDYHEDNFSPVATFTVTKLIMCLVLQKSWTARHLQFENTFPNWLLQQRVY